MSIKLYSLSELNSIGNADVKTNLPELDPTVPGSFIRTLVSANSLLIFAAQRNIEAALLDFFPQTASGVFLEFWAEINALTRVPGTVAEGHVSLEGTLGVSVPLGTLFVSSDNNQYVSTSAATISAVAGSVSLSGDGGTVTAITSVPHSLVDGLSVTMSGAVDTDYNGVYSITALDEFTFTYTKSTAVSIDAGTYSAELADIPISSQDIGVDTNLIAGATLTLQSTVIGIGSGDQATANRDGITAGSDLEGDESLRERVLLANAIDPGVFTNAQIRLDALTIPTATRVCITNPSINYTTDGTDVTTRSVTSITQAVGVATALITDTSNLYAGSTITIAGATDTEYNADWDIISIVTNTSFTFAVPSATGSPAGGTITVSLDKFKNIPQPGTVYVFVLDDNNDPPTPSSTTLTNVKDKIVLKLPAHATEASVEVLGPFFQDVPITITGLSPNNSAMQSAINASLAAFFQDEVSFAEPVKLNKLIAAIQNTQNLESGEFVESFTLVVPTADTEIGNGSMGTLGAVTIS